MTTWIQRQYAPQNTDDGFSRDDIRRGLHTLYIDLECSKCGYTISFANSNGNTSMPCPQCAKEAP